MRYTHVHPYCQPYPHTYHLHTHQEACATRQQLSIRATHGKTAYDAASRHVSSGSRAACFMGMVRGILTDMPLSHRSPTTHTFMAAGNTTAEGTHTTQRRTTLHWHTCMRHRERRYTYMLHHDDEVCGPTCMSLTDMKGCGYLCLARRRSDRTYPCRWLTRAFM